MPPSFIIINEKIVITIIFDSLKLDLKIGKLMRWSNKLLILILCHLNILRILLKLRTFNLLNLFTFILILKRSFFLNFNLLKLRQLLIFIFDDFILYLLLIKIFICILKRFTLDNCWNASLLNVGILVLLWELNVVLVIFFILFRGGLIKWICEFIFNIYKIFIALVGAIFRFILA